MLQAASVTKITFWLRNCHIPNLQYSLDYVPGGSGGQDQGGDRRGPEGGGGRGAGSLTVLLGMSSSSSSVSNWPAAINTQCPWQTCICNSDFYTFRA